MLRRDDPQWDAQIAHPLRKRFPIPGIPDGGRGDCHDALHSVVHADGVHAPETLECLVHGFIAKSSGGGHTSPEAGLILGFFDDGEALGGVELGNDEEYGV